MRIDLDLDDLGKIFLEQALESSGSVKAPIVLVEENGLLQSYSVPLKEEEDPNERHERILGTVANIIWKIDPPELFVGYEGFYLMKCETAVRVLIGIHYSDDFEKVWLAQVHDGKVGEWRDASHCGSRFGFDGLWREAKAHLWN